MDLNLRDCHTGTPDYDQILELATSHHAFPSVPVSSSRARLVNQTNGEIVVVPLPRQLLLNPQEETHTTTTSSSSCLCPPPVTPPSPSDTLRMPVVASSSSSSRASHSDIQRSSTPHFSTSLKKEESDSIKIPVVAATTIPRPDGTFVPLGPGDNVGSSSSGMSTVSTALSSPAVTATNSTKVLNNGAAVLKHSREATPSREGTPLLHTSCATTPTTAILVVTPFLVKHIGDQTQIPKDNFHEYCYRHNPDITCNKLVDEQKLKELQHQLEKLPSRDQEAISHVWSIFSAAPRQHRTLILQGLLTQCCFPQLLFISQEVSVLIRIDFISILPVEIALKILCYLDCRSLCMAAQVSKKWKSLADDDRVWHHMCEQHIDRKCPNCGWGLPLMHMKRNRDVTTLEPKKRAASDVGESSRPRIEELDQDLPNIKRVKLDAEATVVAPTTAVVRRKRPWKEVYSERFMLEKNWRKGFFKVRMFRGHSDGVTCLQFNRKYLVTGSYDTSIKIWRVDTGECIRTLTGHTKGVRSLAFDSQKLITGGLDLTIKVWNYHTGQCISTYRGHDDAVVSVDFHNKTIVSGSADKTVKVWHVDSRTCYTLRGHLDWVNCVKIHPPSSTVFLASDDTTIRMWDLKSNRCLRVFGGMDKEGHIGQVQCVIPFTYKDEMIEDHNDSDSESASNTAESNAFERAEDNVNHINHNNNNNGNMHGNNRDDARQNVTNLGEESTTSEENTSSEDVNQCELSLDVQYPTHLLTCSLDNTIKLWDVRTGRCIRTQFGHIEGVWSISADTFRIISGAHDRLIKVWDLQDGKCLHTFSNDSSISCVGLSDSRFAAGLENGDVKMYCFDEEC